MFSIEDGVVPYVSDGTYECLQNHALAEGDIQGRLEGVRLREES